MHFTRLEHYAMLLMAELTQTDQTGPLSLTTVSKRHGVSLPFLKKIVRFLRSSDLVKSKEGFGGGYTLARKPDSISLWEVLSSFEGVPSDEKPTNTACPLNAFCLPQHIRFIVTRTIKERLERITIKEATS